MQYISPSDSHVLGQAELVVIDEAAAIPLPYVKKLLGPYLVRGHFIPLCCVAQHRTY
jgi:N-acetyltransferase 10